MTDQPSERPEKDFSHDFFQQRLKHHYSQVSASAVILCLFFIALIFIPIGAAVIIASDSIFELDVRYDAINKCTYASNTGAQSFGDGVDVETITMGCTANVPFTLEKTLAAPVFIYYRLKGFYQNYRLYAKSMSEAQLYSDDSGRKSDCEPYDGPDKGALITLDNGARTVSTDDMYYSPCGAVPWSQFNDTISLYTVADLNTVTPTGDLPASATAVCLGGAFTADGTPTTTTACSKKGIAFDHDREVRFRARPSSSATAWTGTGIANTSNVFFNNGWYDKEPGHKIPLVEDEDLMVWSRIAPLPDFYKLYRKIEQQDLAAGRYTWRVEELFDTASMNAEKHIVLATTNWTGGKNHVLGALYLTFGCLSLLLAFGFVGMYIARSKE